MKTWEIRNQRRRTEQPQPVQICTVPSYRVHPRRTFWKWDKQIRLLQNHGTITVKCSTRDSRQSNSWPGSPTDTEGSVTLTLKQINRSAHWLRSAYGYPVLPVGPTRFRHVSASRAQHTHETQGCAKETKTVTKLESESMLLSMRTVNWNSSFGCNARCLRLLRVSWRRKLVYPEWKFHWNTVIITILFPVSYTHLDVYKRQLKTYCFWWRSVEGKG